MPAQWFAVPFKRRDTRPGSPGRYCAMREFDDEIAADGGVWNHFECGGGPNSNFLLGVCFAKVGGVTQTTLNAIGSAAGITSIPTSLLDFDTSLSVLTNPQRNFVERTLTRSLGYTDAEIDAWLAGGRIENKTYGELLAFLATRWYTPVYDPNNPPGPQVGWQNISYPGLIACDGRTVGNITSSPSSPVPKPPSVVAESVPSN